MAVALLVPATTAAAFTLGCALIHAQRQNPDRAMRVLLGIIAVLALCFVIRWTSNESAVAESASDAANPLLLFSE